ncbi:cAMP-responsive element-binding protein 2 [Fasciola gigantica]|uniref:cAMP-responsive element-binding protein 2 n=2 Tax=Fasciola TaxID=6191 RepID=A0A4E0QZT4_FASHE|nr:cAMP-responsive element-binding protein 2 [Fasciola hepatica]TPP63835.1 cAMP-responsive element-binding protein 2 [Fasciola gigantica]
MSLFFISQLSRFSFECDMKRTSEESVTSTVGSSRSSESAKDCRKRKTLRIQYLAESVRSRELTVLKMKQDIDKLLDVCRRLDQGEMPHELLRDLRITNSIAWPTERVVSYSHNNTSST